jgi:hypothetical protein
MWIKYICDKGLWQLSAGEWVWTLILVGFCLALLAVAVQAIREGR